MNKILINNKSVEPLNCVKIIKGEVRTFTNPITGIVTTVGNGEILWERSASRECQHFLLAYNTNTNTNNG